MSPTRRMFACLALLALLVPGHGLAATTTNARRDLWDDRYVLAADQSYVETLTSEITLLTPLGIRQHDRAAITFYPKTQKLEVLEAWVDQPDGTRLDVPEQGRFTRPSAAAQGAPGFTGGETTTVMFPRLQPGSRTHIVWRLTQITPSVGGFGVMSMSNPVDAAEIDRLTIDAPAGLALGWGARGEVRTSDTTRDGRRILTAEMPSHPARRAENGEVSPVDFLPLFAAATTPDFAAIGTLWARQIGDRGQPTPEITALAAKIVGDRTGEAAARALYDWVSTNIRYIAVYMNREDGWVPHQATEVLKNGYGDCKDHVVLLQALLASRGIESRPALIDWSSRFRDLPYPVAYFNHAILYLPAFDVWLNPTDPYAPYGTLDSGLVGKQAVLAGTPGRERHTPEAVPADNRYQRRSTLTLSADGTLSGTATWSLSPDMEISFRHLLSAARSPREALEQIMANTPEGGFGRFTASDVRDLGRPLEVTASWRSPRAVTPPAPETTLLLPASPDIRSVAAYRRLLSADGQRHTPMLTGTADLTWTTSLVLPDGVAASRLPDPVSLSNAAGSYASAVQRDEHGFTITRHLVIAHNVYPPDDVPALEAVLYTALADARATITLVR